MIIDPKFPAGFYVYVNRKKEPIKSPSWRRRELISQLQERGEPTPLILPNLRIQPDSSGHTIIASNNHNYNYKPLYRLPYGLESRNRHFMEELKILLLMIKNGGQYDTAMQERAKIAYQEAENKLTLDTNNQNLKQELEWARIYGQQSKKKTNTSNDASGTYKFIMSQAKRLKAPTESIYTNLARKCVAGLLKFKDKTRRKELRRVLRDSRLQPILHLWNGRAREPVTQPTTKK